MAFKGNEPFNELYAPCVCGHPWDAHEDGYCPFELGAAHDRRYQPAIPRTVGRFGRSKGQPLQGYREVFGHDFDEDADLKEQKWDHGTRMLLRRAEQQFKLDHVLTVPQVAMAEMTYWGQKDFPNETCGFVFGDDHVVHINNIGQYRRGAYTMAPMDMLHAFDEAEKDGLPLRIIYHSHPNMGAFFSSIDRDEALQDHEPTYPEAKYIVMSIRTNGYQRKPKPQLAEARAYQWNPAIKDFSEITLKVEDASKD